MRRIFFTLFILLSAANLHAQGIYEYFNSESFWGKFRFVGDDAPGPGPGDTVIAVVSNRRYLRNERPRFLSQHREADRKTLHYFSIWLRNDTWCIQEKRSLGEAIQQVPDLRKDWVVYTEGMGKIFTSDVDRGMRLAATYNVNVILLDYPSIRTDLKSLRNYYFAIGNARAAHRYFLPVLDSIRILRQSNRLGTGHLSLFFHSMGNNVMRRIARGEELLTLNQDIWVDNLILNAPCVYQKGHRNWVERIAFAKRITIHYNPADNTLKWARLISMRKQLGDRPKGPLAKNAAYVNFNTLAGDSHSNFLALPGRGPMSGIAYEHYRTLFHGQPLPQQTGRYRASIYHGLGRDIIP